VLQQDADAGITYAAQLEFEASPIVLQRRFIVPYNSVKEFLEAAKADSDYFAQHSGHVRSSWRRGIGGSREFLSFIVWGSTLLLREALSAPEFAKVMDGYPKDVVFDAHIFGEAFHSRRVGESPL
jgi:hypothetical protein